MVETVDEGKEVDNAVNRKTPTDRDKKTRYEPTYEGERYEDDVQAKLINYGDKLV